MQQQNTDPSPIVGDSSNAFLGPQAASSEEYPDLKSETDKDIQAEYTENPDVNHLYTTQVALIRFLQDKYSTLLVKGSFDKQTAGYFRSLQKNTPRLPPAALDNLKVAVELAASSC